MSIPCGDWGAREDRLPRAGFPEGVPEPLRPAEERNPPLPDLWALEPRVLPRHEEVAREGEVESPATGNPLDGRDPDLLGVLDPPRDVLAELGRGQGPLRFRVPEVPQVRPRGERPARPGEDRDPDPGLLIRPAHGRP